MVQYKFSRFVTLVDVDDGVVVLVGGTAGAVLGVDDRFRQDLQSALNADEPLRLPIWMREQLRQAEMIIRREVDELAVLSLTRQLARTDPRTISLTIAPTMHCNLSCPYCYEEGGERTGPMALSVQDRIAAMVERELLPRGRLAVTWYGGEPLLARDVIDRLSVKLTAVCERAGARYSSDMVTNGTLMDVQTARWMLKVGITRAQVTVDGPAHVHDLRRVRRGGGGTFEEIIGNVEAAIGLGLRIVVRVNIDQSNADDAFALIDYLHERGLLPGVRIVAGQVIGGDAAVCMDAGTCLDDEQFALTRGRFDAHAARYAPTAVRPPAFRRLYCGAEALHSLVIDPDGRLYKCWRDANRPEHSFGVVGVRHQLHHPNLMRWVARPDPLTDPQCSQCKVLPMCMGGCPARTASGAVQCDVVRYQLPAALCNYYRAVVLGGGRRW